MEPLAAEGAARAVEARAAPLGAEAVPGKALRDAAAMETWAGPPSPGKVAGEPDVAAAGAPPAWVALRVVAAPRAPHSPAAVCHNIRKTCSLAETTCGTWDT